MTGPEMMIAKLLGVKPEEMRAQIEGAMQLMKTGAAAAEKMQSDLLAIKKHLGIEETATEETANVGAIANHGGSANGNRIQL